MHTKTPKYSICMTNYNSINVIKQSIESILNRIDNSTFEIVIVDSMSNDGSLEILYEYEKRFNNFKVIVEKCLRGRGRQIAFENSSGELIITADCDTIYNDAWIELIQYYINNDLDYALSTVYSQIYPRKVLIDVGGWANLQYWEDAELWARLAVVHKYHTYPMISGENIKQNPSSTFIERFYRIYRKIHDRMLLFTEIPSRYYFLGYIKLIKKRWVGMARVWRCVYYLSCVIPATIISYVRRCFTSYGNMASLRDGDIVIDLNIVKANKLQNQKESYDSLQSVIEAYKRDDMGYLPGFYD